MVILVSLVAGTEAFGKNVTSPFTGENKGPGAHTIRNDNPYQGLDVTHEGHGKYSIIFRAPSEHSNEQVHISSYLVHRLRSLFTVFCQFSSYI